jgi:hypothetical protein
LNPGRRGGKPATNRLNYGAAKLWSYNYWFVPQHDTEILATASGIVILLEQHVKSLAQEGLQFHALAALIPVG